MNGIYRDGDVIKLHCDIINKIDFTITKKRLVWFYMNNIKYDSYDIFINVNINDITGFYIKNRDDDRLIPQSAYEFYFKNTLIHNDTHCAIISKNSMNHSLYYCIDGIELTKYEFDNRRELKLNQIFSK